MYNRDMNKELRKLIKQAEAQGFTVRITSKGHVVFYKDGRPVTTAAGTPSDVRSWKNTMAALRRAGFDARG